MKTIKKLNNNAVLVEDGQGKECIVTGRGVGFGSVRGQEIDQEKVEKVFSLVGSPEHGSDYLQDLLTTMPVDYLRIAQRILEIAASKIPAPLERNMLLPLADHIFGAVQRTEQGAAIADLFASEMQRFYPEEFALGKEALGIIAEATGVELPQGEAGFIALHLITAQGGQDASELMRISKVVHAIEQRVIELLRLEVDAQSLTYQRFITHLRFFAQRLITDEALALTIENEHGSEMLDTIALRHPEVVSCVHSVSIQLMAEFGYTIDDAEMLYLSLHLARLVSTQQRDGGEQ
ncbi:PRD domain-containing protein [Corynebacterium pelargi]|uniref:Transcription antiterminator LicT n=1 Tax=Corynebacterium pelargi TaxID=1471400 RepID=A0A410W763_9CORY|nr:PRD domain-containing protein [Corynebacterium pelargi]QAU51744.1 Transcription antiterminator LicT [Corynebacterium pelargi]GGG80920.1 transcription antiterminator LicT [Corynebacterium pelargi]